MKRFYLIKESLLATGMTLIVTFALSFIPAQREFIKALPQGLFGFDIYDLYFSGKHLKDSRKDSNIVIVELANDRAGIARQISLLQKYSPAIIGIDAYFKNTEDLPGSIKLARAINQSHNVVVAYKWDSDTAHTRNFFEDQDHYYPSGYINFIGNEYSVISSYHPFYQSGDSVDWAFSSVIVRNFSPEKFNKLKERNRKIEVINYTGNLESYQVFSNEKLQYYDSTHQLRSELPGKIILLGNFVQDRPPVLEDLHFSPVNERVSGKSFPDMYGVVIHANIISMVLNENYITQASDLVSYCYAFLIIFLFMLYILFQYKKKPHPKHGKFLLIQFFLILLILYLFLQLFSLFQVKTPLLPIMIALVLCVELLGLYRVIALWLHRKYEYQTVFTHQHII